MGVRMSFSRMKDRARPCESLQTTFGFWEDSSPSLCREHPPIAYTPTDCPRNLQARAWLWHRLK